MIDNTEKTVALMERVKAALPLGGEVTAGAHSALREESPDLAFPRPCEITTVYYAGDESGSHRMGTALAPVGPTGSFRLEPIGA